MQEKKLWLAYRVTSFELQLKNVAKNGKCLLFVPFRSISVENIYLMAI